MNKNKVSGWIIYFLRSVLLSIAFCSLFLYLYIAFSRFNYPFELEWMEGGTLDHIHRILAGKKLYVQPSLSFIPYIYTPLYFYLSSLLAFISNPSFTPLRLLSILSSIGSFFMIFLFIKKETKNNFLGIISASFFAATFRISGAWFDLARVDSLFLFLLLISLFLIRFTPNPKTYIIAGIFASLAFLTKQTTLLILSPVLIYILITNRPQAYFLLGTMLIIIGGSTLILDYIHDGWYTFYIFTLPLKHPLENNLWLDFWTQDLFFHLPILCSIIIIYTFRQAIALDKKSFVFYFALTLGMLTGSWSSRLHSGGYYNVLFPAYAAIAILTGVALNTFLKGNKKSTEIFICLLCIIQFTTLRYKILEQLPTLKDLQAGNKLIKQLSETPGNLWVFHHSYLARLSGKNSHAHRMAISDVFKGTEGEIKSKLLEEFKETIKEKKYDTIIIDFYADWPFKEELENNYERTDAVFDQKKVFWTKTGWVTRPQWIYVKK